MQITDIQRPSGCTCHCDTLFHWVSRRAHESDRLFCMGTNSCKNASFPIDGALLSGLSAVAPSEVCISCDTVRDTGKWCCSLAVVALDSSISLDVSPERAVGVTELFCLHLCSGAFAVDTEVSAREGNVAVLAVCARTQWILPLRQQTLVVKKKGRSQSQRVSRRQ